jgi:hypothetical protein
MMSKWFIRLLCFFQGQGEYHPCTKTGLRVYRQGSVVIFDNLIGQRQAEARALTRGLRRVKGFKNGFLQFIGYALTLVHDLDDRLSFTGSGQQIDPIAGLRRVCGIAEQVDQHL